MVVTRRDGKAALLGLDQLVRRPEQVDAIGALDEVRVRAAVGGSDKGRPPTRVALRVGRHPDWRTVKVGAFVSDPSRERIQMFWPPSASDV